MLDGIGRKVWIFPDADLPPPGDFPLKGHESVIVLNMGTEEAQVVVPLETQYAIRVDSSVPVVAQYGRLDSRQANLAYYTTLGYPV
ncbi:MAG: sensory rhodopsin transducer [Spirochaetota bacterium]